MTPNKDDRFERLISRRLDDALSAEEELELNRALIRSPEQRCILGQSERVDVLAGEVLRERIYGAPDAIDFDAITLNRAHIASAGRYWWIVPAVVAACIGSMFLGRLFVPAPSSDGLRVVEGRRSTDTSNSRGRRGVTIPVVSDGIPIEAGALRRVNSGNVLNSRRDANVFGIVGDDGNIYLIEVKRTRTSRQPRLHPNSKMRLVRDDL